MELPAVVGPRAVRPPAAVPIDQAMGWPVGFVMARPAVVSPGVARTATAAPLPLAGPAVLPGWTKAAVSPPTAAMVLPRWAAALFRAPAGAAPALAARTAAERPAPELATMADLLHPARSQLAPALRVPSLRPHSAGRACWAALGQGSAALVPASGSAVAWSAGVAMRPVSRSSRAALERWAALRPASDLERTAQGRLAVRPPVESVVAPDRPVRGPAVAWGRAAAQCWPVGSAEPRDQPAVPVFRLVAAGWEWAWDAAGPAGWRAYVPGWALPPAGVASWAWALVLAALWVARRRWWFCRPA
ncbi:hypothetical protein GCM10009765_18490 [Fodinicola feengrottensis]|uniref:Uncharacterized protein n=1 Tax=Fodinicola feengrottensis TaxID=435914 RepID=A0ABP4S938_9ACTN